MNNTYKIFGTLVFLFLNMLISTAHALIRTTSNDYAIIINTGRRLQDNHEYYWNDCSEIYKLLMVCGYVPCHSKILIKQ